MQRHNSVINSVVFVPHKSQPCLRDREPSVLRERNNTTNLVKQCTQQEKYKAQGVPEQSEDLQQKKNKAQSVPEQSEDLQQKKYKAQGVPEQSEDLRQKKNKAQSVPKQSEDLQQKRQLVHVTFEVSKHGRPANKIKRLRHLLDRVIAPRVRSFQVNNAEKGQVKRYVG